MMMRRFKILLIHLLSLDQRRYSVVYLVQSWYGRILTPTMGQLMEINDVTMIKWFRPWLDWFMSRRFQFCPRCGFFCISSKQIIPHTFPCNYDQLVIELILVPSLLIGTQRTISLAISQLIHLLSSCLAFTWWVSTTLRDAGRWKCQNIDQTGS